VPVSVAISPKPRDGSYLGAEVLQWVALDGVDAEDGVWLHGSESTRQEELLAATLLLDDLD